MMCWLVSLAETTDCLTTLIRLSQIPRNEWDRTEALLRANSADQALFDFSERFDDASSLLRDLGVNRSVDRYKLFTCLNRGENVCHGMTASSVFAY